MAHPVDYVESPAVHLHLTKHSLSIQSPTVHHRVSTERSTTVRSPTFDFQSTVCINRILVDDHDGNDLLKHYCLPESIQPGTSSDVDRSHVVKIKCFGHSRKNGSVLALPSPVRLVAADSRGKRTARLGVTDGGLIDGRT